jgi:Protein of unknown function (DUF4079)
MDPKDFTGLIHPFLAIGVVFPLLGVVVHYATQTRNRRLKLQEGSAEGKSAQGRSAEGKSKIPPTVGAEHLRMGRLFSNAVVILALLGLAYSIFSGFAEKQTWNQEGLRVGFVVLMYGLAIACLVILNRARARVWRGVFATLTGMALVLIGSQPEVYRSSELMDAFQHPEVWISILTSHYYGGILAAMLMIFSLAIFPDIYQDRSQRWRKVHVILNSFAFLLFIGQGFTGVRDLMDIPPTWQKPYVEQLYQNNCQPPQAPGACVVQPKK